MSEPTDLSMVPWRTGTKVHRTIYAVGDGRSWHVDDYDDTAKMSDVLIGLMDSPELAKEAVAAHNARLLSWLRHPSHPAFPGRA